MLRWGVPMTKAPATTISSAPSSARRRRRARKRSRANGQVARKRSIPRRAWQFQSRQRTPRRGRAKPRRRLPNPDAAIQPPAPPANEVSDFAIPRGKRNYTKFFFDYTPINRRRSFQWRPQALGLKPANTGYTAKPHDRGVFQGVVALFVPRGSPARRLCGEGRVRLRGLTTPRRFTDRRRFLRRARRRH